MKLLPGVVASAVVMGLAAGAAQAKIALPSSGDSELVFTVWDPVRGASYALDLGVLLSDFQPADFTDPGFSLVWAPDALLASFLTASGSNPLVWNVVGGDSKGSGAGNRALAFTADPAVTEAGIELLPTVTLDASLALVNTYFGALNQLSTHKNDVNGDGKKNTLDNGSSAVTAGSAFTSASAMQSGLSAFYGSLGLPGLGDSQNFWFVSNGRFAVSPVTALAYGLEAGGDFLHATFTFMQDGTLVFAMPVPEAETWALLGLGLLGLGVLARRRGMHTDPAPAAAA